MSHSHRVHRSKLMKAMEVCIAAGCTYRVIPHPFDFYEIEVPADAHVDKKMAELAPNPLLEKLIEAHANFGDAVMSMVPGEDPESRDLVEMAFWGIRDELLAVDELLEELTKKLQSES